MSETDELSDTCTDAPLLRELAVCLTFFYKPDRIRYLSTVISGYIGLASKTDIYIVTNISDTACILDALPTYPDHMSIHFVTPSGIGHPYLLTWAHREVFREIVATGSASHFLYSEDDLLFTRPNVEYWLRHRGALQAHGLFPSFVRVEESPELGWVSTDCTDPVVLAEQPRLSLEDGTMFVCMQVPYQGLYFLDRELMEEFASSPAFSPDFGPWEIREKASQGLTFANIPKGFTSRNLVIVDRETKTIPREAWIHHLPNNYANDPTCIYAKLPMGEDGIFRDPPPVPKVNKLTASYILPRVKRRLKSILRAIRYG